MLAIAPLANAEHPYLLDKNARPGDLKIVPQNADDLPDDSIIKIGQDWQAAKILREENPGSIVLTAGDLLLPVQDIDGQIWSVQTIQPGGGKFFVTGSKKESNFYVVDGQGRGVGALDDALMIIIAEGYATADTLSQSLDCPVVAAFDSGNLPKVAQVLHERYPQKPTVIAGDDDFIQESVNGTNPGREKAIEAAKLVNGEAVFPIFAPGEQVSMKLSDFNDLANKSTLGVEGVKRQVGSVAASALEQARDQGRARKLTNGLEQNQQENQQKRALAR
ncbi:MAG: toprim domain-containing protein [Nitrosomonas sp.]|nr:toprim domain-containing protein [Nitrosomonas sp.]